MASELEQLQDLAGFLKLGGCIANRLHTAHSSSVTSSMASADGECRANGRKLGWMGAADSCYRSGSIYD